MNIFISVLGVGFSVIPIAIGTPLLKIIGCVLLGLNVYFLCRAIKY